MILDIHNIDGLKSKKDIEVALVIYSWASNIASIYDKNFHVVEDFIFNIAGGEPYSYIMDEHKDSSDDGVFLKLLTYRNLSALLQKLKSCYMDYEDLETCFMQTNNNEKYAHITLSEMFGGGTGFPTKSSHCCFYSYYLLMYWLQEHVWDKKPQKILLLPCSDKILVSAYKKRVITKDTTPTLKNAIKLTNIAREKYEDIYMLLDYILH